MFVYIIKDISFITNKDENLDSEEYYYTIPFSTFTEFKLHKGQNIKKILIIKEFKRDKIN